MHQCQLIEAGWEMREYQVETLTWRDLTARAGSPCGPASAGCGGHQLDVVVGMHGATVLPEVFCAEHGHLGVQALRDAIEPMGYRYDGGANVNSFFVRASAPRPWWRRLSGAWRLVARQLGERAHLYASRPHRQDAVLPPSSTCP